MTNREIDREIAEKVMGWKTDREFIKRWRISETETIHKRYFRPSIEIDDAWLVVEKMKENIQTINLTIEGEKYYCSIISKSIKEEILEVADTAPLAICKASLKAINDKEDRRR